MKQAILSPTLLLPLFAMTEDHQRLLEELQIQGSALEDSAPSELADHGAELKVMSSERLEYSRGF